MAHPTILQTIRPRLLQYFCKNGASPPVEPLAGVAELAKTAGVLRPRDLDAHGIARQYLRLKQWSSCAKPSSKSSANTFLRRLQGKLMLCTRSSRFES